MKRFFGRSGREARRNRRLFLETLEDRRLLAVAVEIMDGPTDTEVVETVQVDEKIDLNPQVTDDVLTALYSGEGEGTDGIGHGGGSVDWLDVNGDKAVSAADALILINGLNANSGAYIYDVFQDTEGYWRDVNFDGAVTPEDVLIVISYINENGAGPWEPFPPAGTLTVGSDPIPASSYVVLGGNSDPLLSIPLDVEGEDMNVTSLLIHAQGNPGVVDSINYIPIWNGGEVVAHAIPIPGERGDFLATMDGDLVIPRDMTYSIGVSVMTLTDEHGGVSGDFVLSVREVRAEGIASGQGVRVGLNYGSEVHTLVGAKIVTVEDANPDADGSNILQAANWAIAQTKFTAASNNNTYSGRNAAELSELTFYVDSGNVLFDAGSFDVYNKSDQSQQINCDLYMLNGTLINPGDSISGEFVVRCSAIDNLGVDLSMESGESITVVLEVSVVNNQNLSTQGSYLQVFTEIGESGLEWLDTDGGLNTVHRGLRFGVDRIASTKYRI